MQMKALSNLLGVSNDLLGVLPGMGSTVFRQGLEVFLTAARRFRGVP